MWRIILFLQYPFIWAEIKYPISTEVFNHLKWTSAPFSQPVSFSARVRRQLTDGTLSYVYDTDTDESTGDWGPWERSEQGCSRTCGGGVLIGEKLIVHISCILNIIKCHIGYFHIPS